MHILILDDENAIKENLNIFLEDEGYSVTSVDTAEKALELINSGNLYDIGIIDVRLPGMYGDEFIINANKLLPGMKFIIHTGSLEFELSSELTAIGLTDKNIFRKPVVDINALIGKINALNTEN